MKHKLLLLMLAMLSSVAAWCTGTTAYVKVTAANSSVSWVPIQVDYKMNGNEYKVLGNCVDTNTEGAVDLDNVWSQSGGTGKHYYITEFDHGAFSGCSKITSVTCSRSGFTTIHSIAFARCTSLTSVSVPYVQEIESQAFWYCTSLKNTNFIWYTSQNQERSFLYRIDANAFDYCSNMESFYIPQSVRMLGNCMFDHCPKLSSITVNENNEYFIVENGALLSKDKTTLYRYVPARTNTSFTIPSSVTAINTYAFEGCKNLKSIVIPDGISIISNSMFQGCDALVSINIPSSVRTIDYYAFVGCSAMSSINIPYGVTTINGGAFNNCGLLSIVIPSSVTTIGSEAFASNSSLSTVTIYAPALTTYGSNAFAYGNLSRKIYVLADKVATYKSGWDSFKNYIEPIALPTNDAGTSGKWCTYYNDGCDVTVADGTTIYKAIVNDAKTQVTLVKVDGNIIKAGEAVVLNTTSSSIVLSSAATSGSGDYTGNSLKGGNTVTDETTAYTLGLVGGQLGFYRYTGTAPLDSYKAHLEIPTNPSSPAPSYFGLSGTTGISNLKNDKIDNNDIWYDLNGRELQGKPTQKGVYVRQGKKYVIK